MLVARTRPEGKVTYLAIFSALPLSFQAAHGISLFLVDAHLPGFHKGSKLKKLGQHGQVSFCSRLSFIGKT